MNLLKIITAACSLMFLMIGADKFLGFLEPPCTLESSISPMIWKVLGVLQLMAGVLLWMPKYTKHVAGFFFVFMLVFSAVHLSQDTRDIGGAVSMAVLLGFLVWSPSFLKGKNAS